VTWATAAGAAGISITSDDDFDGIIALVEYALGLNPKAVSTLPAITRNGNQISIAYPKGVTASTDPRVRYRILGSTDMQTWLEETPTVNSAAVISLEQTLTGTSKFFRLEVTYTP
jgi:hypothetical protein